MIDQTKYQQNGAYRLGYDACLRGEAMGNRAFKSEQDLADYQQGFEDAEKEYTTDYRINLVLSKAIADMRALSESLCPSNPEDDMREEFENVQSLCEWLHQFKDNTDRAAFNKTVDSLIYWAQQRDWDENARELLNPPFLPE